MKNLLLFSFLGILSAVNVKGWGTLTKPVQRSSIWRDPEFAHLNPPQNHDDSGLWCSGKKQDYDAHECGICGDDGSTSIPRPNENGGTYGIGIIVGNYTRGQIIPITFNLNNVQDGYISVQICDDVSNESHECFERRGFLLLDGGTKTQIDVSGIYGDVNTNAKLPADLSCRNCVLRLYYRACKDWGECDGVCACSPPGAMCCGPQEMVLNCADISISL